MKVKSNRAALFEAVQLASSIVPPRTPKPILQCAKIEAQEAEKKLVIVATDGEITLHATVPQVQIVEAGAMVLPAERITAILRESADETVDLEEADGVCQVIGKDSRFRIYGHDAGDFPAVEAIARDGGTQIEAGVLRKMIHQASFAAAKESTRYAINGVLWEQSGKKLYMVATDGRRLTRVEGDLIKAQKETEQTAIIPLKTLMVLERVLNDPEEKVEIVFANNRVVIYTARAELSSTLVQGRFPKYTDVLPTGCDKKTVLQTEAFRSAVRRVALLTNEQSRGVLLTFSKNKLCLTSSAPEAGDAEINMDVNYEGDELKISFNPQYILDMLRVVEEPEITGEFQETNKPGLLRSGKKFLYVLMPVTG